MIYDRFHTHPKSMSLTEENKEDFKQATICHICEKPFDKEDNQLDYCHFSGKYRGAAHNKCSLQCRKPLILPIIFHNLQGYDSHLFIEQLAKVDGEFNCIPSTEEKYISFSKKIKVDEYQLKLITGENVSMNFEIRFIDSFKILEDDYKHAQNVWKTFECKTIKDYHDLYLKSDVLLLADVFGKLQKRLFKTL